MFKHLTKLMAVALCALALVAMQPTAAEAGNRKGLAIGLATGLIIGGILLHNKRANAHVYHRRPHVNYIYDEGYDDYAEDCHRERYLVWKCRRDHKGRKHCSQVERLGKVVCY